MAATVSNDDSTRACKHRPTHYPVHAGPDAAMVTCYLPHQSRTVQEGTVPSMLFHLSQRVGEFLELTLPYKPFRTVCQEDLLLRLLLLAGMHDVHWKSKP